MVFLWLIEGFCVLNGVVLLKLLCKLILIDCWLRDDIYFNYLRFRLDGRIHFSLGLKLNGYNNFTYLRFKLNAFLNQGLLNE